MNFLVAFAMMIASAALSALIAPRPKTTTPTAGKLDVPIAEEGNPVPVVFGTNVMKSPNVVWYGDAKTEPIYSKEGGKK